MSGADFIKYRRIELEDFIAYAKRVVKSFKWSLNHYEYTPEHRAKTEADIMFWEKEVQYAEKDLAEMGGAENEEQFLTEPKRSESPQLQQISCTTVL